MKQKNKFIVYARRHPLLFYIRYFLLSENLRRRTVDQIGCFNDYNSISDVPPYFFEINKQCNITPEGSAFNRALQIAAFLRNRIKGGTALSAWSENTLRSMIEGTGGVCGDFSQIFNVFCLINNIKVKEWHCVRGVIDLKFGHTFNEIYDCKHNKWIAIDIHKGIYFTDESQQFPLSVSELFNGLRQNIKINFVYISDYRPPQPQRLSQVYSRHAIPFVLDKYRNKTTDYFLKTFSALPAIVVHGLMILCGQNYRIVFTLDNYKEKLFPFLYAKKRTLATTN